MTSMKTPSKPAPEPRLVPNLPNKIDFALRLAARELKLTIKPNGDLPDKTLRAIAAKLGEHTGKAPHLRTIRNWRKWRRMIVKDIGYAQALAKLCKMDPDYLTSIEP